MAKKQGVQTHTGWVAGGLFSQTLWRMAQKLPLNERAIKTKRVDGRTARGQAVLPDDLIAAWRHEYETSCISMKAMSAKYGVAYKRMYRLLTYRDRSRIDPKASEPVACSVEGTDPSHPITPLCASSGTDSPFFASR